MYDLIIIGAGPAGLTAGLYAGRYRLNTLILEMLNPGGRILATETIENFPGFTGSVATKDLMSNLEKQVRDLGVEIELTEALELDTHSKVVRCENKSYQANTVIIATGAKPRKLQVPGEDRLTGRGVSYCATCDGPLYRDKEVVVVGGGNAAVEEALYLTRFAKSVNLVHRRDQLRATKILQEKIKANKKIAPVLNSLVTEISGTNRVESVKVRDAVTQKEQTIDCQGIFIYVGNVPNTAFIKGELESDSQGFIITNEELGASQQGIFACGDCRKKTLYQVITACAEGATAADSAQRYLLNK